MPDVSKIILKMKQQPNNIRFDEAARVLSFYGFEQKRQKGSHCFFANKNGTGFTIPKQSPLKAIYIKFILKLIME